MQPHDLDDISEVDLHSHEGPQVQGWPEVQPHEDVPVDVFMEH